MECLGIMSDKEQTRSINEKEKMCSQGKERNQKKDVSTSHMGEFEGAGSGLQYQQCKECQ